MRSSWNVREARPEDGAAIAEAHVRSILDFGPARYDPEVVASWASPRDGSSYVGAMAQGERFFVAESAEGHILGFSSAGLSGVGHVAVYVRGEAARQGMGSALLQAAEGALRELGATEVRIDASLNAEPFYVRHGFRSLGEGDHRLSSGGIMRCVHMAKPL